MMSQQAVKLGFANPSGLDVDSTVQNANIAYPA
jgi:IS5 family transposase